MTTKSVDLFTKEEHVIIADWLNIEPKCDVPDMPDAWDALDELGYHGKASGYGEDDAAVANMVLERIHDTLPQWASVKIRENDDEEAVIITSPWGVSGSPGCTQAAINSTRYYVDT